MKICSKCKISKPLEDFAKNKIKKDGLQCSCKNCCKEYNKKSYQKNKTVTYNRNKKNKQKNKRFLNKVKYKIKCWVCSEDECSTIDFHHLNPLQKDFNLSQLSTYSIKRIKIELRKCIPLCSNCHRKLHANIFCLLLSKNVSLPE